MQYIRGSVDSFNSKAHGISANKPTDGVSSLEDQWRRYARSRLQLFFFYLLLIWVLIMAFDDP